MKNDIRLILLIGISLFAAKFVDAEKYRGKVGNKHTQNTNRVVAEVCSPATGNTDININNVRTRINTGGDMWWDLIDISRYEVPKGSGKTAMFSAALWIGGVDANGQLKVAALRYRQQGNDYWPGPLSTDGTASIDAATCQQYDKHFVITRKEVDEFLSHCDPITGVFIPSPEYQIPLAITNWPWNGEAAKKQSYYLAPFFDRGGDGVYEPSDGDYPYYDVSNSLCPSSPDNIGLPSKPTMGSDPDYGHVSENHGILVDQVLKGDQTLWWVFNDKG
ncbi:MAG: hypothetical protein HGB12_05380, partial [Bacteroidetes bacterium]|nr:hypothetical protein [Bacteroidota bacterium]